MMWYFVVMSGETREEVVARLKRDLLPTLMKGLMYWPLCDFLTFKFIPVHLQVPSTTSNLFPSLRQIKFVNNLEMIKAFSYVPSLEF